MTRITNGLEKIGKGYYPNAHGKGLQKSAAVYLIENKAYVRGDEHNTDKDGFVRVNFCKTFGTFHQLTTLELHKEFTK